MIFLLADRCSAFLHFSRRVLGAFSWLSVYELVEAAEAVVSPFRDGVAKPQRSTGKDFGNVSNPIPVLQNTFPPQYGAPRGRPGKEPYSVQSRRAMFITV